MFDLHNLTAVFLWAGFIGIGFLLCTVVVSRTFGRDRLPRWFWHMFTVAMIAFLVGAVGWFMQSFPGAL